MTDNQKDARAEIALEIDSIRVACDQIMRALATGRDGRALDDAVTVLTRGAATIEGRIGEV